MAENRTSSHAFLLPIGSTTAIPNPNPEDAPSATLNPNPVDAASATLNPNPEHGASATPNHNDAAKASVVPNSNPNPFPTVTATSLLQETENLELENKYITIGGVKYSRFLPSSDLIIPPLPVTIIPNDEPYWTKKSYHIMPYNQLFSHIYSPFPPISTGDDEQNSIPVTPGSETEINPREDKDGVILAATDSKTEIHPSENKDGVILAATDSKTEIHPIQVRPRL